MARGYVDPRCGLCHGWRPGYLDAHMNLGMTLFMQGNRKEAVEYLSRVLKRFPNSPEAHTDFALLLMQTGYANRAKAHLHQALSLRPGFTKAQRLLSILREQQPPAE